MNKSTNQTKKQMKQAKRFILALASVSKRRLLSFLILLSSTIMYAQVSAITGTVVDATGEPVIGATVMENPPRTA